MNKISFCLAFSLAVAGAQAQNLADSISGSLAKYTAQFPQEKVYVHTDKPEYFPGDTIWLKAYAVDASSHLPDTLCKVIYVDFFKKTDGKKVTRQMLKCEQGHAFGSIILLDTLKEGAYELRAYTNWMRNFSPDNFYYKEIFFRTQAKISSDALKKTLTGFNDVSDLQFFPEGGNMISGLQGRVAFKAVNRFGKGVNFKALIVSSHNDTVARIQSHHLGMGSFIFTPKMDEKYYAQIEKDPDAKRFTLPKALSQGYTFFVDNLTSKEKIKVMARNNLPEKDRPILIGQMRGQVIFQEQSEQAGNSFSWLLSRSELTESGVLQLTLFSSSGVPLCERVIYHEAQDKLQVSIQADKKVYSPRGKVSLSIQVRNQDGEPVQGDFSLAAVDLGQVNVDETSQNISNYLLLTSDLQSLRKNGLKGEIEQPHHYFSKSDPKALIDLDILLMTQGWRRFLWTDLWQKRTEKPVYIWESGISLSGKASVDKRKNRNKPIEITLSYFSKTDGLTFSTAKADAAGRFKFSGVDIMTKGTVYLQGRTDDTKDKVTVTLDSLEFPIFNSSSNEVDPIVIDNNKLQLLSTQQPKFTERDAVFQFNKTKLLPEVMVKASKTNLRADSRRMLYKGTDFRTIKVTPELCSMYGNMFDMLRDRIPFLQVDRDAKGNVIMSMRGQSSIRGAVPPAVLVDGVQLDPSILMTISPCQVESLDYVRSIVMTTGTPGLISIMTKVYSGNEIVEPTPPGSAGSGFKIIGFTTPREFYSPAYSTEESVDKKLHDFRSTLFWAPIIRTDASGNAQITFWNSDEKTNVHVTLEGISSDGQPVYTTAEYTVE